MYQIEHNVCHITIHQIEHAICLMEHTTCQIEHIAHQICAWW
jgi:hypothetical protein